MLGERRRGRRSVRAAEHDRGRPAAAIPGAAGRLSRRGEARARSRAASCSGSITRIPDHPARPSQYDLDHAWPFFSYVIVSVMAGEDKLLTSWRLSDDRSAFDEENRTSRANDEQCTKILIPTPLRPFTDKLDAVEIDGATIGELLQNLTTKYGGLKQHLYQRRRQAAQLRQRLRQRRGHPLSAEGSDAAQGGRHGEHHPVGGGRRADCGDEAHRRRCRSSPATRSSATAGT